MGILVIPFPWQCEVGHREQCVEPRQDTARGGQKSNHDLIWFDLNGFLYLLIWFDRRFDYVIWFDAFFKSRDLIWFDDLVPMNQIWFDLNLRNHYRSIFWFKTWIQAKPMAPMERARWELSIGAIFVYETTILTFLWLDFGYTRTSDLKSESNLDLIWRNIFA